MLNPNEIFEVTEKMIQESINATKRDQKEFLEFMETIKKGRN
jgi:hypothetical protein